MIKAKDNYGLFISDGDEQGQGQPEIPAKGNAEAPGTVVSLGLDLDPSFHEHNCIGIRAGKRNKGGDQYTRIEFNPHWADNDNIKETAGCQAKENLEGERISSCPLFTVHRYQSPSMSG